MNNFISFDEPKVKALRKAHDLAVEQGRTTFTFEGTELLVSYAKYLLEFLECRFRATEPTK